MVVVGMRQLLKRIVHGNKTKRRIIAPIGAWKCNFPPFKEIMTDRPTSGVIGKLHVQKPIKQTLA